MDLSSYCFDTSPFFDATFDVSAWVQQLLGPEPKETFLEQLQNDLVRLEAALKSEVVAVVNKDYAGFVQLSSKIEGFESAIHHLKPPLLTVEERLRMVREDVNTAIDGMRAVMSKRDSMRTARLVLQDLLHANDIMEKVEAAVVGDSLSLPTGPPGGAAHSDVDVETACARLLRVAHWFSSLNGLWAKHGHLPYFILMNARQKVRTEQGCGAVVAHGVLSMKPSTWGGAVLLPIGYR
jgi:hypothetical protein